MLYNAVFCIIQITVEEGKENKEEGVRLSHEPLFAQARIEEKNYKVNFTKSMFGDAILLTALLSQVDA